MQIYLIEKKKFQFFKNEKKNIYVFGVMNENDLGI